MLKESREDLGSVGQSVWLGIPSEWVIDGSSRDDDHGVQQKKSKTMRERYKTRIDLLTRKLLDVTSARRQACFHVTEHSWSLASDVSPGAHTMTRAGNIGKCWWRSIIRKKCATDERPALAYTSLVAAVKNEQQLYKIKDLHN